MSRERWLPEGWQHPPRVELSTGHHLRPIRPDDTELDMLAVMGSQERLWSIYGEAWGWPPPTMTAEQDREDLQHHADEMVRNESFNYALLDAEETVLLGCVYIDPPDKAGADAEISWWVRDWYVGRRSRARSTRSCRAGSPRTGRSSSRGTSAATSAGRSGWRSRARPTRWLVGGEVDVAELASPSSGDSSRTGPVWEKEVQQVARDGDREGGMSSASCQACELGGTEAEAVDVAVDRGWAGRCRRRAGGAAAVGAPRLAAADAGRQQANCCEACADRPRRPAGARERASASALSGLDHRPRVACPTSFQSSSVIASAADLPASKLAVRPG